MDNIHASHDPISNAHEIAQDYQTADDLTTAHFNELSECLDSLNALLIKSAQTEKLIDEIHTYIKSGDNAFASNREEKSGYLKYLHKITEPVLLQSTFVTHYIEDLEEYISSEAALNHELKHSHQKWDSIHKKNKH